MFRARLMRSPPNEGSKYRFQCEAACRFPPHVRQRASARDRMRSSTTPCNARRMVGRAAASLASSRGKEPASRGESHTTHFHLQKP